MIRNKVHFVPAGIEQWNSNEVHAYVKYGAQERTGLRRFQSRVSEFDFHDRRVWLVTTLSKGKTLPTFDYDVVVPVLAPEVVTEPFVLINPYHATKAFDHSFSTVKRKVIVDSGGFQMLRGTTDFVDPDKLLEFYNKFGDICMPLDLPLPSSVEPYYFDKVTKMMKANDDYMLPRLDQGKILALVSQGSTASNRLRRLEGLKRTSKVVAIAGLNTLVDGNQEHKLLTALSNGLSVIDMMRKTTRYFHFLGVTAISWFILYSIMVGRSYVERCGGDSVSHRIMSINGTYIYGLGGKTRSSSISRTQRMPLGTHCRCPLCQVLPDQRPYLDARYLESHNLWNLTETKNLIADSVELYLAGHVTLKDLCDQWLGGSYSTMARAVEYLNTVIDKGYREWKPKSTFGLFDKPVRTPGGLDHYTKILKRYEQYHGKKFT